MQKKKIVLIAIFMIGISFLLYPRIGNIITSYNQRKSIKKYAEAVVAIDKEKNKELYEEAVKYNEKIYEYKKAKRRYNFEDEYVNILKLNDSNILGYIEIPKAKISLPIYHGVKDNVLQKGVGHVRESSLPIGTVNQNSMLMGHSGLPISKIFTNLEKLKKGDYIKITVLDRKLYYRITETEVIDPDDVIDRLKIEEGKDLITLVTCTPYGVNSHRLIIHAERAKDAPAEQIDQMIEEETPSDIAMIILVSVSTIGLIILIILIYKYIKKKKIEKNRIEAERKAKESKKSKKSSIKTSAEKEAKKEAPKVVKHKKKKKKKAATKKRIREKNNKKRGKKNAKKR
ncbi:MAG: class C sortase [Bacilli bacterium]|nr:class C sortase [Bacilli bacterium]